MTISKNTQVRILTTNGGDSIATLVVAYRPSYPVVLLNRFGGEFTVAPERIKSIQPTGARA